MEPVLVGRVIVRYRDRPWWDVFVALSFFAIALVLYATGFYAFSVAEQLPLWMLVSQSAVLCVAQMFRKKAPLTVLAIATAILLADFAYGVTLPVIIVFVDLLFSATMMSPRSATKFLFGGVVAIVLAVGVVTAVVSVNDWRDAFFNMINAFSLLVVPVWWAFNVRQHAEIAEAEREKAGQVRKIAELDRRAAVAAERARMARDLHDVVAGHLSAIAIQSEALLTMADRDPQVVRTVLKSVRENSIQSLAEMRAMIDVLRADGGDNDPRTAPARLAELDRLLDSARAGGLDLEVRSDPTGDLPVAVDLAAYRILQEALTNALKHAPGGVASVEVRVEGERLIVEVTNDLTGDPGTGTGTGLVSMRERAQAVGGEFFAGPRSGRWRIRADLPTGGVES